MRRSVARLSSLCVFVAGSTLAAPALGEPSVAGAFVDVPLTLPPFHFSADAAVGAGTSETGTSVSGGPTQWSTTVGAGANVAVALGLPFLGEIGARIGYRLGVSGIDADVDQYARLFDPIFTEPGGQGGTNPELHLRGTLVPLDVFELGLETRVVIPTASASVLELIPGVPIRVHIPGFLRVDTGAWLGAIFATQGSPYDGSTATVYAFQIPAQAYFQIGDLFVGPQTGVTYLFGGLENDLLIPLGVGVGYTVARVVDFKAQIRTESINQIDNVPQTFGFGLGMGIRVP